MEGAGQNTKEVLMNKLRLYQAASALAAIATVAIASGAGWKF
jgi:hypothetical protein